MVKFFEALINKFFDFFNFGRFITIIIPGLITTLCLTMLVSQLIFPARKGLEPGPVSKIQLKEIATDEVILVQKTNGQWVITEVDKETLFKRQVSEDYKRVSNNFSLVVLLAIVIGLMLYELGYRVLLSFPREKDKELFRYDPQHDADKEPTHKFGFSTDPVGLVYFAPFLKERFSGEENYFNFIVTEYYRFVEFSVNMPISIIVSGMMGVAYWGLFSLRNSYWPYCSGFASFFLTLFAVSIGFLLFVSPRIFTAYKKACKDLVQGVSDLMSKGLLK